MIGFERDRLPGAPGSYPDRSRTERSAPHRGQMGSAAIEKPPCAAAHGGLVRPGSGSAAYGFFFGFLLVVTVGSEVESSPISRSMLASGLKMNCTSLVNR